MSDGLVVRAADNRSEEDVRRLIHSLILELAPTTDRVSVDNPHLFDDLEYHSLALLELAFTLEDEFDLEPIDEQTAQQIATAQDVEDYVVGKLRERTG